MDRHVIDYDTVELNTVDEEIIFPSVFYKDRLNP